MHAPRPVEQPLREAIARELEALARDARSGRLALWQVERLSHVTGVERELANKIADGRARSSVGVGYAHRFDGGNWLVSYPCGCRRLQDEAGSLLGRGWCETHRALVVMDGGSADGPRPQRGLASVLRRVK